jgi:hypothetical protein
VRERRDERVLHPSLARDVVALDHDEPATDRSVRERGAQRGGVGAAPVQVGLEPTWKRKASASK